jgi:hypothetical protein
MRSGLFTIPSAIIASIVTNNLMGDKFYTNKGLVYTCLLGSSFYGFFLSEKSYMKLIFSLFSALMIGTVYKQVKY